MFVVLGISGRGCACVQSLHERRHVIVNEVINESYRVTGEGLEAMVDVAHVEHRRHILESHHRSYSDGHREAASTVVEM